MSHFDITEAYGMGGPSPIIRRSLSEGKKYEFTTYGSRPENKGEWEGLHGYGACGCAGYTNDIQVVVNYIILHNNNKARALCDLDTIKDLIEWCKENDSTMGLELIWSTIKDLNFEKKETTE